MDAAIFTPTNSTLIAVAKPGNVGLWDWMKNEFQWIRSKGNCFRLCATPDGKRCIMSGDYDVCVWSIEELRILRTTDTKEVVLSLVVFPDGRQFVGGLENGEIT